MKVKVQYVFFLFVCFFDSVGLLQVDGCCIFFLVSEMKVRALEIELRLHLPLGRPVVDCQLLFNFRAKC